MSDTYILNEQGQPVAEPDVMKWGQWFGLHHDRRVVKQEMIGDTKVSTVFLGVDHGWGSPIPILWETLCFGGKLEGEMDRCSGSREQAEAMHQKMVERVKAA